MRIASVLLTGIVLTSVVACELNQPLPKRQASGTVGGVGLEGAGVTPAPTQPAYQPPGADLVNQPNSASAAAEPQAAAPDTQAPAAPSGSAAAPTSPAAQPGTPTQQAGQPGSNVQPAAAGVTGKGNYQPGLITTPVSIYFRVQERLIFEVQIPHAMQLFEAENGYKPRSHEEFMEKIIKANNLELPDLPPGHRYVYDPERGELMVEHPG
jgi:hypothetical protein